jgi:hypothetical protein
MKYPHIPDDWPVVERGLVMAYVGKTMVVYADERVDEHGFERELSELQRAFDMLRKYRIPGERNGALWEVPSFTLQDARRRQRIARILDQHHDMLRETTAGFALVTKSPALRGVLRAIFWLAPPPYPWQVVDAPRAGFDFLASKIPEIDAVAATAQYERLLERHLPR